jgi:hypothetical protein
MAPNLKRLGSLITAFAGLWIVLLGLIATYDTDHNMGPQAPCFR